MNLKDREAFRIERRWQKHNIQKGLQLKLKKLDDAGLWALFALKIPREGSIYRLAKIEAQRRGLLIPSDNNAAICPREVADKNEARLKGWNWPAMLGAPLWTLRFNLDFWFFLLFVPFVNLAALFYLGWKGNKLSYHAGEFNSIETYLHYKKWFSKRIMWVVLIFTLFELISIWLGG